MRLEVRFGKRVVDLARGARPCDRERAIGLEQRLLRLKVVDDDRGARRAHVLREEADDIRAAGRGQGAEDLHVLQALFLLDQFHLIWQEK